ARHQLDNTRAALAVCEVLGVPAPPRLEVVFTPLREEEHELAGGVLLLNDCYNANPLSMRAALENLAERAAERRRIAVLGEMAELGAGAGEFHREVGRRAAELGVDQTGMPRSRAIVTSGRSPGTPGLFTSTSTPSSRSRSSSLPSDRSTRTTSSPRSLRRRATAWPERASP